MEKETTILYDPQIFAIQDYGGISRYFANLISGIKVIDGYDALLPLLYSSNYYVRNFPQFLNPALGKKLLKGYGKRNKWNRIFGSQQIKRGNYDAFHATYYHPYFLEHLRKPLVITIHDMIYENYPELFAESEEVIKQKKMIIESANLIIAISEFTKTQILKHYPNLSTPIRVVHHGMPAVNLQPATDSHPENFILYVGDRHAIYKNFRPFIQAITPILNEKKGMHLICAGGGSFNDVEKELFRKANITDQLTQVNASDSLLTQLYRNAKLFVYPSIEEGFGLPVLEAFRNGCGIACSNSSSLPEVAGDAVSYFDPFSKDSMSNTIQNLILNPEIRLAGIEKGFEQVEKFTFERSLRLTLDCYKSLL